MKLLQTFVLIITVVLSGCAAVTITDTGSADFRYRPHYQDSKHFFLWGLIGEHRINVREICGDQAVKQMQTRFEPLDVLWGGVTLGLYLPRTAKVWCTLEDEV